jgi:DNA-binding CsgD family transcriptional regulator
MNVQTYQTVHFTNPLERPTLPSRRSRKHAESTRQENSGALQGALDNVMGGILILTDQQELVYVNEFARRVLRQLNVDEVSANNIPQEIGHICQSLIHSRSLFPDQHWLMESEIFASDSTALHIRARWLQVDNLNHPYLLLTLEDRYQARKNIAAEEAQKYGLTAREKEVWLLLRANYTYKQIAQELSISPNTVKKHIRSIHMKQVSVKE